MITNMATSGYSKTVTSIEDATRTTEQNVRIMRHGIAWILCQTTASFFTLIAVYLTFTAIIYKYRVWKKTRLQNGNHAALAPQISTISGENNNNVNNKRRVTVTSAASSIASPNKSTSWRASALDILIIAAAVFATLRMVSEQQVLNFSDRDRNLCDAIADIHVALYALPIAAIYIFLWLRQRIFYSNPPLSLFNSAKVRAVSVTIIAVMVVGEIVTALVFTLTITYKPGALGCEPDGSVFPKWAPWLLIIFFTGIFQILLLSLYIRPIIYMRLDNSRSRGDSENGELRRHGGGRIMKSIKRVCFITCACVASDALAVFITFVAHVPIVSNLVYDLNLIVNLVGIICSFTNWKERLCPLCCREKHPKTQSIRALQQHPASCRPSVDSVTMDGCYTSQGSERSDGKPRAQGA